MAAKRAVLSAPADDTARLGGRRQAINAADAAERLRASAEAAGLTQAGLAKAVGVSTSTVGDWWHGRKMPGSDVLFPLGDVLGVNPRWLVYGEGERSPSQHTADTDAVNLPLYDLFDFGAQDYGKPTPVSDVALQPDWLRGVGRSSTGLWLATMPSDALPDIAREGATIVCQDVAPPLQDGRAYVLLLDGRPIVRRVQLRPEGLTLLTSDRTEEPTVIRPDDLDRIAPIGRILAAITLQPA